MTGFSFSLVASSCCAFFWMLYIFIRVTYSYYCLTIIHRNSWWLRNFCHYFRATKSLKTTDAAIVTHSIIVLFSNFRFYAESERKLFQQWVLFRSREQDITSISGKLDDEAAARAQLQRQVRELEAKASELQEDIDMEKELKMKLERQKQDIIEVSSQLEKIFYKQVSELECSFRLKRAVNSKLYYKFELLCCNCGQHFLKNWWDVRLKVTETEPRNFFGDKHFSLPFLKFRWAEFDPYTYCHLYHFCHSIEVIKGDNNSTNQSSCVNRIYSAPLPPPA